MITNDYVKDMAKETIKAIEDYIAQHPDHARLGKEVIACIEHNPNEIDVDIDDHDCGETTIITASIDYSIGRNEFSVVVTGALTEYYEYEPNEDGEVDMWVGDYDIEIIGVKVWVSIDPAC